MKAAAGQTSGRLYGFFVVRTFHIAACYWLGEPILCHRSDLIIQHKPGRLLVFSLTGFTKKVRIFQSYLEQCYNR